MKMNKLFTAIAIAVVFALCVPFCCVLSVAAAEEEQANKWDSLQAAYMTAPFANIAERIYANGPTVDPVTGSIPSMKLIYPTIEAFEKVEDQFVLKIDNAQYALYVDDLTGELVCLKLVDRDEDGYADVHPDFLSSTVKDIDNNDVSVFDYCGKWATNPYSIGSSTAATSVKAQLYSQLIIEYTDNGVAEKYYSFEESALYDQIKVSGIKNGARVEYAVGEQAVKYLVPFFITEEKYNALMAQVEAGLRAAYPNDSDFNFYFEKATVLYRDYTKDDLAGQPEYIINAVERLGTCYLYDYKTGKGKNLDLLESYISEYTNYTYEQLDEDHAETGYTVATEAPASFKLAIEYTFDEYGMMIRCSAGNIRFDSSSFQLDDVYLLPYAGAGDINNEGFALYPDGSGAIIDFKDARSQTFTLVTTSYGQDYAFSTISGANNEDARLPVFGMTEVATDDEGNKNSSGFLAYVEEGESLADISVNCVANSHPYLQAYTKFNPRPSDQYSLSGGISSGSTMWTVEAKRKYTRNYRVRIFILEEQDTSYSEMANTLRNYLIDKGVISLMEAKEETDIPLVIETLGAIETTARVLGVPYAKMQALTSFDDVQKNIVGKLRGEDVAEPINNIVVKLNGWLDGGLDYNVPSGVDIEDALGGEDGFKSLVAFCEKNNVTLYPDFDFSYSRVDEMFDGFDADKDLARTIDDRKSYKKTYNPIYQTYDYSGQGVISANRMMHFYDSTFAEYKNYKVGNISVSTLGGNLNSDFNEDDPLNREDSKVLVDRLLKKVSEQNENVMLSGGNIFTVKYADIILDVPLEDSMLRYTSTEIPFYSMVLHGSVEYAGSALNLAGDYQASVLKTIESGAVPYFIVAAQNTSDLKNSGVYSMYYSVRYSIWLEDIYYTYHKINDVLSNVKYSQIIKHEFLDDYYNVVRVTYDNGYSIVINYNDEEFTYRDNGIYTVDASGILIFKDGALVTNE